MSGLLGIHIPPPDIEVFPPHFPVPSSMSTLMPWSAAPSAVAKPAAPEPTTTTSYVWSKVTMCVAPSSLFVLTGQVCPVCSLLAWGFRPEPATGGALRRSEEHTSELQSRG